MAKSVPLPESWLATLPTELSHRLFAKARHSRHLGNPRTMRCTRVCTEFACQIFRATARQHRRRVALGSWRSGTVRPRPSAFVVLRTARPASVNSAPSRRLAQKSRRSAANSGNRSYCPCAHRYSTAKFWPSTKPCSLRIKTALAVRAPLRPEDFRTDLAAKNAVAAGAVQPLAGDYSVERLLRARRRGFDFEADRVVPTGGRAVCPFRPAV
jgi:hypothetical protein